LKHYLILAAFAFSLALSVSAIEAQRPAPSPKAAANVATKIAATRDTRQYSEPALIGKVIDEETKLPLQGVIVYGHYATASGSLAGGDAPGELVRSFETETDANGVFKLDAWDTGDRPDVKGEPRGRFPAMGFFKPGYDLQMLGLNSVREFRPRTFVKTLIKPEVMENTIDWTKVPFEMRPVKTEKERDTAISNLQYPMRTAGKCGWESYKRIYWAQHLEKKEMIKRLVAPTDINSDGYLKSGRPHPTNFLDFLTPTGVDQLIREYKTSPSKWGCANPLVVFFSRTDATHEIQ
jgi:hypothetical protein